MEKVLQELLWAHLFGHPYRLNGTKIYLDAAMNYFRLKTTMTILLNLFFSKHRAALAHVYQ